MTIAIQPDDALIVVDVQNDFLPGGALAVVNGDEVIPIINRLADCLPVRVFTRDWHPKDHASFSEHPALTDKSWPAHCVQDTPGAEFPSSLKIQSGDKIVSKGVDREREAYSGFQDTGLAEWLKARGIRRVVVTGLATDYCVKNTALDALTAGFKVLLVQDACRGVDLPAGTAAAAVADMNKAGVGIIQSRELVCP